jgi:hypothetical protein
MDTATEDGSGRRRRARKAERAAEAEAARAGRLTEARDASGAITIKQGLGTLTFTGRALVQTGPLGMRRVIPLTRIADAQVRDGSGLYLTTVDGERHTLVRTVNTPTWKFRALCDAVTDALAGLPPPA